MTTKSRISTALLAGCAVLFAGLAAIACRPEQTVERQTKDAALEAQVKAKLAADVGASTVTAVEVNVTNGVVTLAGPVGSEDEKQKAEAAARSVEGVTGVNNNLQVMTEVAPPPGVPSPIGGYPPGAMTPLHVGPTPPTAMTPEPAMPPPTPVPSPATTPY